MIFSYDLVVILMHHNIKNLVFEGGGILGVAYLGALDYLNEIDILPTIKNVAGSSSGALTSCLACFNLPFKELKTMAATLDYKKIIEQKVIPLRCVNNDFRNNFEKMFGNINSIYRLIHNYGWYSNNYFYNWIKKVIETQFDKNKKKPPYTFEDFKNKDIHIEKRPFKDLYVIGTDISYKTSVIFSYETTPKMEVAEAVKISMSIPLLFETVKIKDNNKEYVFVDGGLMRNYPINIFDHNMINYETLGIQFCNNTKYKETKNIVDYITNLFDALLKVQEDIYNNDPINKVRTITINTGGISSLDFNISDNDYKFLYDQGYEATVDYFENKKIY
jgi:NTE family protein